MHPETKRGRIWQEENSPLSIPLLMIVVMLAMTMVMSLAWATQRRLRNGGWIDVFWTFGTGLALAAAAVAPTAPGEPASLRQALVAILVLAWSLRLGTYIARRVAGRAEDPRYARMRADWGRSFDWRMVGFCLVQAGATALLSVSVLLAARHPAPDLRAADLAGFAILAAAIAGEAVADAQLARFRADPANRGKVADTGLWAWSRHPNYFFEWLTWLAYPVIALDPARPWTWLALSAPAVMYLVLTRGTGVPPLEAAMLRSRGAAYCDYQARTSAFFPRPPRKGPAT